MHHGEEEKLLVSPSLTDERTERRTREMWQDVVTFLPWVPLSTSTPLDLNKPDPFSDLREPGVVNVEHLRKQTQEGGLRRLIQPVLIM